MSFVFVGLSTKPGFDSKNLVFEKKADFWGKVVFC